MSLYIASLNSGSNGNCYYVGNSNEAVLVDVGISCREVEKRMARLQLSMTKIKAIFISHEHSDHIKGLEVLSKKYLIPVYITNATLNNSRLDLNRTLVRSFKAYDPIIIGSLIIKAFPKFHDAADPYSFTIEGNDTRVGVMTDIGSVCDHVIQNFSQCQAVFLEANYDDGMLTSGYYPYHLKQRIKSDKGHLSNHQALELFVKHKQEFMTHLILSHLSKDNNCPILVKNLFTPHSGNAEVIVASRFQETELFHVTKSCDTKEFSVDSGRTIQTSLF